MHIKKPQRLIRSAVVNHTNTARRFDVFGSLLMLLLSKPNVKAETSIPLLGLTEIMPLERLQCVQDQPIVNYEVLGPIYAFSGLGKLLFEFAYGLDCHFRIAANVHVRIHGFPVYFFPFFIT
jgi:hypothetical protein